MPEPSAESTPSEVLDRLELPLPDRRDGKVRISWALDGDRRLFVTTDRLSAFDRIIASVPCKGQVLNQLSAHWFGLIGDRGIVAHHLIDVPDPNVMLARRADPLPVEVIVRGRITGVTDTSLWIRYEAGQRVIDGHRLPDGLAKNDPLPQPIITPTTKGDAGTHDVPLSCAEVVERGLVGAELWEQVQRAALRVFSLGVEHGETAGLVLADTKYEFGLSTDGALMLIDEVHTPDSSRWWVADGLAERCARGEEPESLDKEVVRRALAEVGYRGEGPVPDLGPEVWTATTARYVDAYERLTGRRFIPADTPPDTRIRAALTRLELIHP